MNYMGLLTRCGALQYELEAQCYISCDQVFLTEADLKILINQISDCKKTSQRIH